jgi:trans-aconitate methyltransferase
MAKYEHRNKASKPFVDFWGSLTSKEEGKGRADYVMKPIKEYCRDAKSVLEIGCGIGEVLVTLPERFDICGLDIEKDYIEVCKKRIPRGKFLVSSMHNFKVDEKFDVVFSANDAVNFLKSFDQWKSTFQKVSEHLDRNGLFIFDVYTPKELKDALKWLKKFKTSASSVRVLKRILLRQRTDKGQYIDLGFQNL